MLEMVEDDERVGEHQRHVGQAERIRRGIAEGLHGADEVIAEESDGAADEGRRVLASAPDWCGQALRSDRVRVASVGERPAEHRARAEPDERPAPHALALVGGLEQERRLAGRELAELQERRHRRLAVLDEGVCDRDQVVLACQLAGLLERRLDARGREIQRR